MASNDVEANKAVLLSQVVSSQPKLKPVATVEESLPGKTYVC